MLNKKITTIISLSISLTFISAITVPAIAVPDQTVVTKTIANPPQKYSVNSDVETQTIVRDTYGATSEEEMVAIKAEQERVAAEAIAAAKAIEDARIAEEQKRFAAEHARTGGGLNSQVYTGPVNGLWVRPVSGPVSSVYGPREIICNGAGCSNSFHDGIDFSNDCGTPIVAASAGRVTFAGPSGAYGNRVIIDHGNGVETIYGHVQSGSIKVSVGDTVDAGTGIANVGATGVVSGCHLDLKVRIGGKFTNPASFLIAHKVSL